MSVFCIRWNEHVYLNINVDKGLASDKLQTYANVITIRL